MSEDPRSVNGNGDADSSFSDLSAFEERMNALKSKYDGLFSDSATPAPGSTASSGATTPRAPRATPTPPSTSSSGYRPSSGSYTPSSGSSYTPPSSGGSLGTPPVPRLSRPSSLPPRGESASTSRSSSSVPPREEEHPRPSTTPRPSSRTTGTRPTTSTSSTGSGTTRPFTSFTPVPPAPSSAPSPSTSPRATSSTRRPTRPVLPAAAPEPERDSDRDQLTTSRLFPSMPKLDLDAAPSPAPAAQQPLSQAEALKAAQTILQQIANETQQSAPSSTRRRSSSKPPRPVEEALPPVEEPVEAPLDFVPPPSIDVTEEVDEQEEPDSSSRPAPAVKVTQKRGSEPKAPQQKRAPETRATKKTPEAKPSTKSERRSGTKTPAPLPSSTDESATSAKSRTPEVVRAATGDSSGPVVEVNGLTVTYEHVAGEPQALQGLTASFERGEFTVVMGRSGSGKSTLLYCLNGLVKPTAGTIKVDGKTVSKMSTRDLTKLRRATVSTIFQDCNLLPELNVQENIMLPLKISGQNVSSSWTDKVIETLDLQSSLTKKPYQLHTGVQQRVACARAMITRPVVVLADEPTGNLDSASANEVLGFLRQASTELGQSIVMVTHDPEAAAFGDRVIFISDGMVAGEVADPTLDSVMNAMLSLSAGV